MNRSLLFTAFCLLLTACGSKPQPPQEMQSIDVNKNLPGDSTRYGILLSDSTSQQAPDTAVIQLLRRDSLTLRFKDHEQAYFKKEEKQ